MEAGAQLFK